MTPPPTPPDSRRAGQALAELTISLVVLIILILGATTLIHICLRQQTLRRDARLQAGTDALSRGTVGWSEIPLFPENRSDSFHKVNARTHLEEYAPALTPLTPSSNYTLASRDMPEAELGLKETTLSEVVTLEQPFVQLIYQKGSVNLSETTFFPALTNLYH